MTIRVTISGKQGSGKTTLASAVAQLCAAAKLNVHVDDGEDAESIPVAKPAAIVRGLGRLAHNSVEIKVEQAR